MKMEAAKNESAMVAENARLRGDLLTIASRISHDLRTPLGAIITSTEVLREILVEQKIPTTLADGIIASVDDMTRLIKQINVVIRATTNRLPKERVQMGEIVEMSLQRLERKIQEKKATIARPDSWPQVNGVTAWLDVIWSSFLTNALQHSTKTPRIELSWREENGHYHFGISDNGGGVPDLIRPGLFKPFDSLHKANGTRGLGLSIVQRLVDLQGGNCGYEPVPGGSYFFFSLPR